MQLRILANMYFPRERGIGENVAAILEITDPANTTRMKDTNGTGAVVIRNRRVGRFAYVGAGAVVIHDVAEGVKVAGVPAQEIGTQSEPSLR